MAVFFNCQKFLSRVIDYDTMVNKDNLDDLNPIQKEAVLLNDGPLLILAGAGSGKTRLLTYKIAYLIRELSADPRSILAITFTNKAATEMKMRIEKLVGGRLANDMWISTFHSACNRILRVYAKKIGFDSNFAIYDARDSYQLVSETLKEMDLDPKQYPPKGILTAISGAKSRLLEPEAYVMTTEDDFEEIAASVYFKYQAKLFDNQAMDFDDLINMTVKLLRKDEIVLARFRDQFKYVLVDEYQDTNPSQYRLIHLLGSGGKNLTVVGDEDQSIYAFRMADVKNILDFEDDFPGTTVVKLEQNYRSTKKILEAANNVIKRNLSRSGKILWTANPEGGIVSVYAAENELAEVDFVVNEIERLVEIEGEQLSECAIFYRTHAQSRVLEEALLRRGISYRVIGSLRFYERKEIKDILAYLWVIYNPSSNLQLRRIVNVPKRGIGDRTVAKIEAYAARNKISLYQALNRIDDIKVGARAGKQIVDFLMMMDELINTKESASLNGLVKKVLSRTGYTEELSAERTAQARSRLENLDEFLSVIRGYETGSTVEDLAAFMQQVSLITPADISDEESEGVNLMSLHSAKGLEYENVFIIGMEEGIFPHSRSLGESDQLEEERRLCYVGMTRARERLYMTYAYSRLLYGQRLANKPSRFVEEIPGELLHYVGKEKRSEASLKAVYPGEVVFHDKWGEGMVVDVEGRDENAIATINFEGLGTKRVLLMYTPLKLKDEQ